ncbi:Zinc finger protein 692, partial [Balearica regulorum gibbericeps]
EPNLLHADALQRLVVLSHGHGQECGFIPDVKPPAPGSTSQLVWECVAGHSFSWGVPAAVRDHLLPILLLSQHPGSTNPISTYHNSCHLLAAPQVPTETGTTAKDHGSVLVPEEKVEQGAEPQEEEEEEEEEDFAEDDDLTYTDDLRDENYHPSLDSDSEPQRRQSQTKTRKKTVKEEQPPNEPILTGSSPLEEKSGRVSAALFKAQLGYRAPIYKHWIIFFPSSLFAATGRTELKDFYDCKRRARPCDEDVAQIGPKRIRKAAKREILLCDFEGCGKIFSNRQYLNHHKKYQHVHQKTFTCSEPSCGKSFNFKKHLKEHEKLHSDKRDYICEFCARSFRTSSNLIIHRRIHTGEKPLQCEICGFTCRQKASLNWHMKKHDADSFYQFSCNICGKKFEKKDNVTAHKSKSHPEAPGAPPQTEASQRQTVPSPPLSFSAGMQAGLEHPEAPA